MAAHKHAKELHAFADGAQIQAKAFGSDWMDDPSPVWFTDWEYRIKPAELERAVVKTQMTADQLFEYFISAPGGDNANACVVVANRAIQHALDRGQVVTREEFDRMWGDRDKRDEAVALAALEYINKWIDKGLRPLLTKGMRVSTEPHHILAILAEVKP